MLLKFKANVNDKYNPKLVYRKGEQYEIPAERAKELLKALPDLIEDCTPQKAPKTAEAPEESKDKEDKDAETSKDTEKTDESKSAESKTNKE